MDSLAKCNMRIGVAADVKAIWFGEVPWIAIGRADHRQNDLPGRNGLAVQHKFASRHAEHPVQRRAETQNLFNGGRKKIRLRLKTRELFRIFDKANNRV